MICGNFSPRLLALSWAPALCWLLACASLYAGPGAKAADDLNVDVGAKAVAMGGGQFGAENDAFAPFYNPALLSGISRREIGLMHNEYFENLRQDVVSYAHPTERNGAFGAFVSYLNYGKITGYNAQGARTGDISAGSYYGGVSWGRMWNFMAGEKSFEGICTGLSLKIVGDDLAGDSKQSLVADAGFAYEFKSRYFSNMKLAAAVNNLSAGGGTNAPARKIRAGLAYSMMGGALTAAADGVSSANGGFYPLAGLQYRVMKMISLRFGYKNSRYLNQRFTYGVGFETPLFKVDYSFIPFGDLGNTHRVSVIYRFGKTSRMATADNRLKDKVKEAKTLYGQGLLVDAFMICFQVQRVAPWMEENNKFLAKIRQDFKNLEESDQKDKLIHHVQALFTRAEQFFESGNLLDARTEFQAVLVLQPDNKAAKGYLRQIEDLFKSLMESFYQMGMVALETRDYSRARDEFERVLAIKPDHKDAQACLDKCLEELENKKQDMEEARKGLSRISAD